MKNLHRERERATILFFVNDLKSHLSLQPLFNTIAWTLKLKVGMTSFGYIKVEGKFLAHRI